MNAEKVNILLVGDQVENLIGIEVLLADLRQNLIRAESGFDALRLVHEQEFALIIVDEEIPALNSFETALIRERERARQTPIICLTKASETAQHPFRDHAAGVVDYVMKPVVPEVLLAKVTAFVELYRKTEEVQRQTRLLQQMVAELASSNDEIRKLNVELEAERDFVSTVLDTADSIVVVVDAAQKIVRASRAFERTLGYTQHEVHAKDLDSFFASPGPGEEAENYWRTKDGRRRLIAWSKTTLGNDHFILTGNDITERKRAEEQREQIIRAEVGRAEAEASERRSAFLAEASTILVATLDHERTLPNICTLAVPAFADWCFLYLAPAGDVFSSGLDLQTANENGHRNEEKIQPESLPIANVLETGMSELLIDINDELWTTVPDQAKYTTLEQLGLRSATVAAIPGRQGAVGVIGFASKKAHQYSSTDVVFVEDLARRISLALESARVYREAQEANRAKDEFLATLSHELRTPLNAILGWTQILGYKRVDEVTAARAFEAIERNAKSQAQLIENMLDVSQIITGRMRLDLRPVRLAESAEAAVNAVRPAAEAKGVRLESTLDDTVRISGDPHRLKQIIWNLLSNAVKFTAKGGIVRVTLGYTTSEAKLTVADNGMGITSQFLPYIFDRFRQAESRTAGGLGLGLSIARHLVELHGGVIEAASQGKGLGATFTVTFPLRTSLSAAAIENAS